MVAGAFPRGRPARWAAERHGGTKRSPTADAAPLRVLMLAPQFRPLVGGYERAAERLSRKLAERGVQVTVVTERRERRWPAVERTDGFVIRRVWCLHRPRLHRVTSAASLAAYLFRHGSGFDVWHLHQYGENAVIALACARILRRPVVMKVTSTGACGLAATAAAMPMPKVAARLFRSVAACVATTPETAAEAREFGIAAARVVVIGNGVDASGLGSADLATKERKKVDLGVRARGLVLVVGRLSAEKNPFAAVEAWERALFSSEPGWQLVFVGDGPLRASLESRIASSPARESISLVGQRDDVADWLAAADIFLLSSDIEGLSNAMLEAMACGLPVVSTRVSGTRNLLEQSGAGIVVEIGRPDLLGEALAKMIAAPDLRAAAGQAGRSVIDRSYGIGVVAGQYLQLYRGVLERYASGQE